MEPLHELARELNQVGVRHLLVGVVAANCWANDGGLVGTVHRREFLLAPETDSLDRTWGVLRSLNYTLRQGRERLPVPMPEGTAAECIEQRIPTTGYRLKDRFLVEVLTTFPGPDFEELWASHRVFQAEGAELRVPLLRHVLQGLQARQQRFDSLIVATWADGIHEFRWGSAYMRRFMAEVRAGRERLSKA